MPEPTHPGPAAEYIRKVNTEMLLTFYVALRRYLTATPSVAEDIANARSALAAFGGNPDITLTELTAPLLARTLDETEANVRANRISPSLTAAEDQAEAAARAERGSYRKGE
jgi:hypothetical protein